MKSNNPSKIAYKMIDPQDLIVGNVIAWPSCSCMGRVEGLADIPDDPPPDPNILVYKVKKLQGCEKHKNYWSNYFSCAFISFEIGKLTSILKG